MTRAVPVSLVVLGLVLAAILGYGAAMSPPLTALGLAALLALVLFAVNSKAALLILVFATFIEDVLPEVGSGLSASKLLGALVIGSWLLRRLTDRRLPPLRIGGPEIGMVVFAAVLLLSIVRASDHGVAQSFFLRYAMFFALAVVLIDHMRSIQDVRDVVLAVVAGGTLAALLGIVSVLFLGENRAQGPLNDPNDLAFALAMAVVLGFFLAMHRTGLSRLLLLVAVAVMTGGLVATLSRGAGVGLAAGGLFGLVTRRIRLRYVTVTSVAVVLVLVVMYVAEPERVSSALELKQNYATVTIDQRFDRWEAALRMLADRPLLGVGVGQYGLLIDAYGGSGFARGDSTVHDVAHNMYLEVAAETGVLGLLPFLAVLIVAYLYAVEVSRRARRGPVPEGDPESVESTIGLADGALAALVTLLMASVFLTEQYFAPLWIVVGLIAGLHRVVVNGQEVGEEAAP